jgi:hypothetical protein
MQYYEFPGTGDAADLLTTKSLRLLGDIRHAQCPVVKVAANSFVPGRRKRGQSA